MSLVSSSTFRSSWLKPTIMTRFIYNSKIRICNRNKSSCAWILCWIEIDTTLVPRTSEEGWWLRRITLMPCLYAKASRKLLKQTIHRDCSTNAGRNPTTNQYCNSISKTADNPLWTASSRSTNHRSWSTTGPTCVSAPNASRQSLPSPMIIRSHLKREMSSNHQTKPLVSIKICWARKWKHRRGRSRRRRHKLRQLSIWIQRWGRICVFLLVINLRRHKDQIEIKRVNISKPWRQDWASKTIIVLCTKTPAILLSSMACLPKPTLLAQKLSTEKYKRNWTHKSNHHCSEAIT